MAFRMPKKRKKKLGATFSGRPYWLKKNNLLKLGFSKYLDEYIRSTLWLGIRERVLDRDGRVCCKCGGEATQVHHTSYSMAALSGRDISTLVSICAFCHRNAEFVRGKKVSLRVANYRIRPWVGDRFKKRPAPKPKPLRKPPTERDATGIPAVRCAFKTLRRGQCCGSGNLTWCGLNCCWIHHPYSSYQTSSKRRSPFPRVFVESAN